MLTTHFQNFKTILFFSLLWLPYVVCARQVDTFYGPMEIQEPILLELIDHPSFQRLKHIHQYGVSYYTTHQEEYNRFDHSIGVFAILRENHASLKEQIAGLLHDVSHTAFSHVGDWVFGKENQEKNYQDSIHENFLEKSGLAEILRKYHYNPDDILPNEEFFPALENRLPNLCADRIDYNIQGAFYQGFITHEEALLIFKDLRFVNKKWISTRPDLMKKLTYFSLFMTQDCWGSPTNYVASRWLADAIIRGIEMGIISKEEFHFGTDHEIWDKLMREKDPIIAKKMKMVMNANSYFAIVNATAQYDFIVKSKFRGINPWILTNPDCVRLTNMDAKLADDFEAVRKQLCEGWPIKIFQSVE